jgi:GntR family transcriptional repressor for pyruvate dehydrogenase complex
MTAISKFKVERVAAMETLTDRVFGALKRIVNDKDSKPGARLPSELEMAGRFGVSRTVIREAVSRLKSEGLVESRQGRGVFVRDRNMHAPFRIDPSLMDSIESVLQVVELRQSLEGEIAALAAKRRTREQMAAIRRALKKIETDEQAGGDGVEADLAFHRRIAEAAGNPHFLALIEFLLNFLIESTRTARSCKEGRDTFLQEVREEHQRIAEAISRRDSEATHLAARRHMELASRRLGSIKID